MARIDEILKFMTERGASDLHLTGIVSEHGYQGQSHWLMFLFEVKRRLTHLPPSHREGRFQFFSHNTLFNNSYLKNSYYLIEVKKIYFS